MEPKDAGDCIRKMRKEHVAAAAQIHAKELSGDFLPSLGENFLKTLYDGMLASQQCIGFVYAIDERVVGFILAAKDTKKLFRDTLLKKGLILALRALTAAVLRPSAIPKTIQTILYPKEKNTTAELLVIAVDDAHKHMGVGSSLVAALNAAYAQEGVPEYKVLVYKNNENANRFYETTGFRLDRSSRLYGHECNIYKCRLQDRRTP